MRWLLWLYPTRWRQRYGDEFLALVEERGWSVSVVLDVLLGALDARLHPELAGTPAPVSAGAPGPRPDRFDKFTRRSRNVLQLAQSEAERLRHGEIGTEHLLLGLLLEGDGVAAHVLADLEVQVDDIRSELLSRIQQAASTDAHQRIGLSAAAKRSIELSVREANRLHHRFLGTEHLLLGVVGAGEGLAAELLRQRKITDMDELRRHILRRINAGPVVR
jgi:hypothetical protein